MTRPLSIEELLEHAAWLRRLAASLVADPARADDLVQETWLAALRRPPAEDVAPQRWLARVVRNMARNRARTETRRGERERLQSAEEPAHAPDSIAAEAEAQRLLAEAVVELDEPLRAVVVLRYFRGLDSNAAARELGVPAGTVRWRTAKALEELRARLDRRFGGERKAWVALLAPLAREEAAAVSAGAGGLLLATTTLVVSAALGLAALVWVARGFGGSPESASAHEEAPTSVRLADLGAGTVGLPEAGSAVAERSAVPAPEPAAAHVTADDAELSGVVLIGGRPPTLSLELVLTPWKAPRRMPAVPVDAQAEPVAARAAPKTPTSPREVRVQPDGSFRFDGLPHGFHGVLRAKGYLHASQGLEVTAPASGLVLNLPPGITGRLLARATPIAEAWFHWGYSVDAMVPGEAGDVSSAGSQQTDAEGLFYVALQGAEPGVGRARLGVEHDLGYVSLESAPFEASQGLELGDIELGPVRRLAVRVLDPSGAPIADAQARIDGPFLDSRAAPATDAEGSTELVFAPTTPFRLRVDALRYGTAWLPVTDEEAVELTLPPRGGLSLHLLVEDEARLRGVRVVLRGSPGWCDEPERDPEDKVADMFRPQFLANIGASPLFRLEGEPCARSCSPWDDGRVNVPGLPPDVPFAFEVRAKDGRLLATRTFVLGQAEWLELELRIEP
jgi:RNA polymerase sigma factor (sigma-70 family)